MEPPWFRSLSQAWTSEFSPFPTVWCPDQDLSPDQGSLSNPPNLDSGTQAPFNLDFFPETLGLLWVPEKPSEVDSSQA